MRITPATFLCLIALLMLSKTSYTQVNYKFAGGLRLSTAAPTLNNAISIKYFTADNTAVEGIISFGTRFGVGILYEMHQPINATGGLTWFYGGGGYVGIGNKKAYVGPTGVLGMDYKFENIPFNLSLDWKPELDIVPNINFVPDAFALSARFTFK
jgi:hypothetical protein